MSHFKEFFPPHYNRASWNRA